MTTTYEKHSTTTDALDTLGSIITKNEKRDAIHLAVENVVAAERLLPGDHVFFDEGGLAIRSKVGQGIGIVDPFLEAPVQPNERFWLVVYPRQIHSLRHVWEHPAFPPSGETDVKAPEPTALSFPSQWEPAAGPEASRVWLVSYADQIGVSFSQLIASIEQCQETGYLSIYDEEIHEEVPDEFWFHAEQFIGKFIRERPSYFSCSC